MKTFLHIITAPGCGNHMLWDVLKQTAWQRVPNDLVLFFMAFVTASKGENRIIANEKVLSAPASQVLLELYKSAGVTVGDDLCDSALPAMWLRASLPASDADYYFLHGFLFSFETILQTEQGIAEWTLEDRDRAASLLREAVEACGLKYHRTVFLRHPVNVVLSNRERFQDRQDTSKINTQLCQFFDLAQVLANADVPVHRYEDFCKDPETAKKALQEMSLAISDIQQVELSILHKGELDKWRRYPWQHVLEIGQDFQAAMRSFGYSIDDPGAFLRRWHRLTSYGAKLSAEIANIRLVLSGNQEAESAFVRHRHTLFSRILIKLLMQVPACRRRFDAL